jgi:hypothetical protein
MYISDFLPGGGDAATSFTAGETVARGQVAVLGADGLGYYGADPSTAFSAARPIFNPANQVNALVAPPSTPFTGASAWTNFNRLAMAAMGTGNTMLAWSNGTNILFGFWNSAGVLQGTINTVAGSNVAGAGLGTSLCVTVLNNGNFVLFWYGANTAAGYAGIPTFAIFSQTGVLVTGPTVAYAQVNMTAGASQDLGVAALSTGGFAVVLQAELNVSGALEATPFYAVFGAAGATVVAATQLNVTAIHGGGYACSVSIVALTGGNFVCAYVITTASSGSVAFFKTFTSAGVAAVGETQIATDQNGGGAGGGIPLVALTGGGFAVACPNWTNAVCGFAIYSAAGVLQGAFVSVYAPTGTVGVPINLLPTADGGVLAFYPGGAAPFFNYYTKYSAAGVQQIAPTTLPSPIAGTASVNTMNTVIQANGLILIGGFSSSGLYWLMVLNATTFAVVCCGNVAGFPANSTQTNLPILSITAPSFTPRNAGLVFGIFGTGGTMGLIITAIQACVPVGVWQTPATQGNVASAKYVGSATLVTPFAQPYNVNAQDNSPPGVKMNILGSNAIIQGIQSTTLRNIN